MRCMSAPTWAPGGLPRKGHAGLQAGARIIPEYAPRRERGEPAHQTTRSRLARMAPRSRPVRPPRRTRGDIRQRGRGHHPGRCRVFRRFRPDGRAGRPGGVRASPGRAHGGHGRDHGSPAVDTGCSDANGTSNEGASSSPAVLWSSLASTFVSPANRRRRSSASMCEDLDAAVTRCALGPGNARTGSACLPVARTAPRRQRVR